MEKIIAISLAVICILSLIAWYLSSGKTIMIGRYLKTVNSHMIIDKRGTPIVMSNQTSDTTLFDSLSNGDKIIVAGDGIDEIYPAQMGVYSCKKIASGSIEDIPKNTLSELKDLRWIID